MTQVLSGALAHRHAKGWLGLACACPGLMLCWGALDGSLGPNPAEYWIRATGDWTLRFLGLTLLVTPLRIIWRLPVLARYRRLLGLGTFGYACLHVLGYAGLDMGFDLEDLSQDVLQRPFIAVGLMAWVILSALAMTSFQRAMRGLGAVRWQRLHRLVYVAVVLGVVHFYWMRASKNNLVEVWLYALFFALVLGWRVGYHWVSHNRPKAS